MMDLKKKGTRPSDAGNPEYFTGAVRTEPLSQPPEPARVAVVQVTFEAGARSAWHTHPLGQTLVVTEGSGRVQNWGDKLVEIETGDVVWAPPGEKHWHGASPTKGMTHLAIQEGKDGSFVKWEEHVTDEQYQGK
jgi:quercetin dioxygenase-like cupin family protein